ncbi:hypothetical protein [Streptomyces beigongshangae]|uniref:hypothetical protein n=1 Tax=Streptomyces beigongshangae TaxID=2841597 RepID=UPI0021A73A13|nr:hypothetical protein [Streptomyces sp. REN17]
MTYPDGPFPGLAPEQSTMFEGAALTYPRYRPGLPDATGRLLAGTLWGRPSPGLLDLGTGQVSFARRAGARRVDGSLIEEATFRVLLAERPKEAR